MNSRAGKVSITPTFNMLVESVRKVLFGLADGISTRLQHGFETLCLSPALYASILVCYAPQLAFMLTRC